MCESSECLIAFGPSYSPNEERNSSVYMDFVIGLPIHIEEKLSIHGQPDS